MLKKFANLILELCLSRQNGFFPPSDAPDQRYSEISGIRYVDSTEYYDDTLSDNRKQLNYNGKGIRQSPPPGAYQYYQPSSPYRPAINSAGSSNVIRKPPKHPYRYVSSPSNYYSSYPTDLSNPYYQNYANHYQYPTSSPRPTYPDYYNPTRYPSPAGANLNGQHPILHQQPSTQYPNYYTNNYANQFGYQRPTSSSIYGNNGAGAGVASFFNNFRDSSGPLGQISQVGGQFGKALEEISQHDDLQCVPKILCQMVRSQRRPNQLPSFMNVPGLSA